MVNKLRDQGTRMEKITTEQTRRATYMLNKGTAVGVDQWSPAIWRDMSDGALEALVALLNGIEQRLTWPAHLYHNFIVLMGKPAGGTRPIALMAMLYRLWTKVRRPQIDS